MRTCTEYNNLTVVSDRACARRIAFLTTMYRACARGITPSFPKFDFWPMGLLRALIFHLDTKFDANILIDVTSFVGYGLEIGTLRLQLITLNQMWHRGLVVPDSPRLIMDATFLNHSPFGVCHGSSPPGLYPSIRVRTAPPVSVRVSVSFRVTLLRILNVLNVLKLMDAGYCLYVHIFMKNIKSLEPFNFLQF